MKKITLCAIALMASATSFAQTTLWNGEDKQLGTSNTGVWDRCAPEVVENPSKTGVNTSDKCLKFTITGTDWNNGLRLAHRQNFLKQAPVSEDEEGRELQCACGADI